MKKVGNTTSNKLYNPDNKKPPVPLDADEVDSAMERFIRAKYANQALLSMRRNHTGSTGSDETPPPLPPKTPGKFSFRGASSTFPLFSRSKKDIASRASHSSPQLAPTSPTSAHRPKVSKVFGASLGYDSEDDVQKKMAKLRELGFADDRKNEAILKGVHGNLERAIETLVRIEGRSPVTSPADEFPPVSRPSVSHGNLTTSSTSLTVQRAETARPMSASTNPFDVSPVQPISSQSTGNLVNRNPFFNTTSNNTNPFGFTNAPSNDALNQAFNMSLNNTSPPLFPHHTGGLHNQQNPQVLYQQTMTPPVPTMPQDYAATTFNHNQTYAQQELQPAQPLQPMQTGYNPFFNNMISQSQPQLQSNRSMPSLNTGLVAQPTGGGYANNPFARSPTRMASPTPLGQIPEQTQQNFYSQPVQQAMPANNPFFAQQAAGSYMPQQQQQQQQYYQQQQQSQYDPFGQPLVQQVPPKADKASILALYNYPQLAPQPPQGDNVGSQQLNQQMGQQGPSTTTQMPQAPVAVANTMDAPVAPAAMPGTKNPFLNGSGSPQPAPAQVATMDGVVGNRSRDSMMALGMEWSNGRHSPDAFASLSARSLR